MEICWKLYNEIKPQKIGFEIIITILKFCQAELRTHNNNVYLHNKICLKNRQIFRFSLDFFPPQKLQQMQQLQFSLKMG